jgi:hypothetical protein
MSSPLRFLGKKLPLNLFGGMCCLVLLASCQKWEDNPGKGDPRLDRKYCNDPEAVNYNRDFPGTADNSVCYYPSDAFSGQYSFIDSIYDQGNKLIKTENLTLTLTALTHSKFKMEGLCSGGGTVINFTSNRQLHADADSTVSSGQLFCRPLDTLSGYIAQNPVDSNRIRFTIQVVSDTAINLHEGMAYRL